MRPLTCEEAIQRLHSFLDRELDAEEVAEVRTHLENCAECRSKFRFEASFSRLVRSQAGGQSAPIGLRKRIVDRIVRPASVLRRPSPSLPGNIIDPPLL